MEIIEMSGLHLGTICDGAYFLRPDTDEEKALLEEFIKKIREMPENQMGEEGSD